MDSNTQPSQSTLQNTLPDQNPAEITQLQAAFAYQNELIKDFQGQLSSLRAANEHLMCYIQSLQPTRPDPVRISLPDKFDGSAEKCRGFLRQCTIYFYNQPEAFRRDSAKCSFMMSLLTGKALEWASAVWDQDDCLKTSFDYFSKQIREVFEYPAGGRDVSLQLLVTSRKSHSSRLCHWVSHPSGAKWLEWGSIETSVQAGPQSDVTGRNCMQGRRHRFSPTDFISYKDW